MWAHRKTTSYPPKNPVMLTRLSTVQSTPMRRRLFTVLSAVAFVLCAAAAVLWVSTLQITFENPAMPDPGFYLVGSIPWLGWLSVGLLIAALGFLAAQVRNTARIKRRLRDGLCIFCGYDLRMSADRCPECGTPTNSKPMPTDYPLISN